MYIFIYKPAYPPPCQPARSRTNNQLTIATPLHSITKNHITREPTGGTGPETKQTTTDARAVEQNHRSALPKKVQGLGMEFWAPNKRGRKAQDVNSKRTHTHTYYSYYLVFQMNSGGSKRRRKTSITHCFISPLLFIFSPTNHFASIDDGDGRRNANLEWRILGRLESSRLKEFHRA